ncbi:MAG TPA: hypothetical protein VGD68_01605 [Streptosporangiaceae bacterium]
MPVLMLVAAVVILAGVVVVASGRGGEMAVAAPDYPPIDLGPVTAADVALLRPPSAAWGYNMRVTDEALGVIARAVTRRDVEIAVLQQELADLRGQLGAGGRTATLEPAGDTGGAGDGDRAGDGGGTGDSGPAVPVTRPQPVYQEPRDQEDAGLSAPWEPAPPPEQAPLWEPPSSEPAPGWSANPADTSPDATALDWNAAATQDEAASTVAPAGASPAEPSPAEAAPAEAAGTAPAEAAAPPGPAEPEGRTSLPVTPATGWRAPTGSVWDAASRLVDQDQDQNQGQGQARRAGARDDRDDRWDKDPHQRLVWGTANAQAKSARGAGEPPPGEPPEDDRG